MQRFQLGRWLAAVLGSVLLVALAVGDASAQQHDKVTIVIFGPPSLGAFLPPLIKAQKLDEASNLDITFEERPPDA